MSEGRIAGLNVSRETMQALQQYEALVAHWTPAINLISKASVPAMWDRHIVDSAQLFAFCPAGAKRWMDFGSGAGFPGLVMAILAREVMPSLFVTLVEVDQRKSTFLRHVATTLGLKVTVLTDRAEVVSPANADVISARAVAALADLLPYAVRHLAPNGVAVFPKGARHAEEVATARRGWKFNLESHASVSDPDAAILIIRNIERAKQD